MLGNPTEDGDLMIIDEYCSASEFRHPSEVRHLYFMTILKIFTVQLRHLYIPCR